MKGLRALRALRPLRLLSKLEQTKVTTCGAENQKAREKEERGEEEEAKQKDERAEEKGAENAKRRRIDSFAPKFLISSLLRLLLRLSSLPCGRVSQL